MDPAMEGDAVARRISPRGASFPGGIAYTGGRFPSWSPGGLAVPRVVSFIVLLGILLLIGTMFFQVMINFVVPLFVAAVLVVVFKPLHLWVQEKLPDRPRASAMATTLLIVLVVLLPTVLLGWRAYVESHDKVASFLSDKEKTAQLVHEINDKASGLLEWYEETFKTELNVRSIVENAGKRITAIVLSGVKAIFGLLVGLAIMTLALYYFLADGRALIDTLMRLSPLDDAYERELLDKFANVSRAVVVASLLSALAQGVLAGAGYFVAFSVGEPAIADQAFSAEPAAAAADAQGAPIALLTMLTIVLALVPFVGGAAVWIPVVAWIYFVQGRPVAAIGLGVYCAVVVSSIDNLIKPYILHGQSNLHPLLALISVLGGVQVLGPVGILVGPMLVAFLQAILNMVHKELHLLGRPDAIRAAALAGVDDAVRVQAEGLAGVEPAAPHPAPRPAVPPQSSKSSPKRRGKRGR